MLRMNFRSARQGRSLLPLALQVWWRVRRQLADDLEPFRQGADLTITVTKINTVNNVGGFDTGTAEARVAATRTVSPRP